MRTTLATLACTLLGAGCPKVNGTNGPHGGNGPSGPMVNPPAKVIYLARHGRTHSNRISRISGQIHADELDQLGFKQRVGLFLLLRQQPIKAIFTSQSVRTQQTAGLLTAHFGLKPIISPRLNEFAPGLFEGICYKFLGKRPHLGPRKDICDQTSDDPLVKRAEKYLRKERRRSFKVGVSYAAPGGGDSILMVEKRVTEFIRRFPRQYRDSTVLLVGHSGTNRFLLGKMMGWPVLAARRVRQSNTVVFRIERRGPKQRPDLKAYVRGEWRTCGDPHRFRKGLDCLKVAKKPPATAPGRTPDGMGRPAPVRRRSYEGPVKPP